jgi:LPXTG-motif cell wall-anchored protein
MIPSTGSAGWDMVLQIGIVLAALVAIVLMIKNLRDR